MKSSALGAIGAVKTDSQISLQAHRALYGLLLAPRAAFIALLRLNIGGLASVLAQSAFEVSPEVTATQKAPNFWWDLQAKWRNAWWNLGGKWSSFVNAVNAGKNKKALFKKLLPKDIGSKLDQLGIGGIEETPIGADPATAGTTAANAAVIIVAVGKLLIGTLNVLLANKRSKEQGEFAMDLSAEEARNNERRIQEAHQIAIENARIEQERKRKELEESDAFSLSNLLTNEDGTISQAGYGIVGVAVLGLLLVGTKKKGKKLI